MAIFTIGVGCGDIEREVVTSIHEVDISLAHKVYLCRGFCRDTLLLLNLFDIHSKSIERKMCFQPLVT